VNGAICRSEISSQFYLAKESFTAVPNNTCRWEYQYKTTGTVVAGEHKEAVCFERKLRTKSEEMPIIWLCIRPTPAYASRFNFLTVQKINYLTRRSAGRRLMIECVCVYVLLLSCRFHEKNYIYALTQTRDFIFDAVTLDS
jgi:hypothetical protein